MELFNEVNESVVAVIGCGCSSATEKGAKVNNGRLPLVSGIYNIGEALSSFVYF